ncbi:unnamed protein product, partial [Rotaria sp. Silwood1]
MTQDDFQLSDPSAVHRAQSHYIRLLWSYLINKQNEEKTIQQFTQLISVIMKIQSITKQLKDFIR